MRCATIEFSKREDERIRGKGGRKTDRYVEINDMIFGKGWRKDGVYKGALEGRLDGGGSGIVEWWAHIYRRMARAHVTIDGYGGEKRVMMIAFGVRKKGGLRGIRRVMKEMIANGNVKNVL
jgi:hypothetical protein